MTDVHCTNCGRELEEFEDVILVASGYVHQIADSEYAACESDDSYLHILCKTCAEGLEIAGVVMESTLAQEKCEEDPIARGVRHVMEWFAEEQADVCSKCGGSDLGHLPGCPDGMASVNLRA